MIEKHEVIVGEWIKKEVYNLCEDLSCSMFFYDTAEADKRFSFEENLCFQGKAPRNLHPKRRAESTVQAR